MNNQVILEMGYCQQHLERNKVHGKVVRNSILISIFSALIAMFIIKVDGTEVISKAEIDSTVKPYVYVSPMDMIIKETFIRDGEDVKAGDIIFKGSNDSILESISNQKYLINLNKKILEKQNLLKEKIIYRLSIEKGNQEERKTIIEQYVKNRENRIATMKKQLESIENIQSDATKVFKLSELAISLKLISQEKFIKEKIDLEKIESEKNSITSNIFSAEMQIDQFSLASLATIRNELDMFSLEDSFVELESEAFKTQKTLISLEESLSYKVKALEDLNMKSTFDGRVSFSNIDLNSSLIKQGQEIATIFPSETKYICKCYISEKSINRIKIGAKVLIKLDAYDYLKYGPVVGAVKYIKNPENSLVELIVELEENKNIKLGNHYIAHGEVVVDTAPLYMYIYKKIFSQS